MTKNRKPQTVLLILLAIAVPFLGVGLFAQSGVPNPLLTLDSSGILSSYSTSGPIDLTNAFFQDLGPMGEPATPAMYPVKLGPYRRVGLRSGSP
jgi:hypothetical protein